MGKLKVILLVFVLNIFCVNEIFAQKYVIHKYTEEDGLPSSYITSITQDSNGVIWMATKKGMASYNGIEWTEHKFNGLVSDSIFWVRTDEEGCLWLLQKKNNVILSKKVNNKWISYDFMPLHYKEINPRHIMFHLTTYKKKTYAATAFYDSSVYYFRENNWINISQRHGLPKVHVTALYNIKDTLYIGTRKGIYYYTNSKLFNTLNTKYGLENETIYGIASAKEGNKEQFWIMTGNFIAYIENGRLIKKVENLNIKYDLTSFPFQFVPNYFNSILFSNVLYVKFFDKVTSSLTELNKRKGLIDNGCSDAFIDRENILWLASYRGLSKISTLMFESYTEANGMADEEVASIAQRKNGDYILGHNKGLSVFDGKNFKRISLPGVYQSERINRIVCDNTGNSWIAGYNNGIGILSPNNSLKWYSCLELGVDAVMSISIDNYQNIYFNDNKDIYRLQGNKTIRLIIENFNKAYIRGVFFLNDNRMLITTSNGIYIVKNGKAEHFRIEDKVHKANNVFSYYIYPNGKMLLGTEVGVFELEGDKFKKVNFNNEKLNKSIYTILKDKVGNLWFGTDYGIYKWNGEELWRYGSKEGLAGLEINRSAVLLMPNGNIMIGTNRGLSIYRPEFEINRKIPPVSKLVSIQTRNKVLDLNKPQKVDYDDNDLTFKFNVISFYDEKKNEIHYKLEGYDTDWKKMIITNSSEIRYQNLKPNKYIFKMKGKNSLGVFSEEISTKEIVIKDAFWNSLFGWLVIIFSIAFVTILLVMLIIKKKYSKNLEDKVIERTKQLSISENRYKQMFEENNAFMLIIDPNNGNIIDANPAALELFDSVKNILIGKSLFDFTDTEGTSSSKLNELIVNKEVEVSRYFENPGTNRHLKIHASRIETETGDLLYCIIDDITQQKNASIQLQLFNEELEDRVIERTADLEQAMLTLNAEIEYRTQAEQELIDAKEELEISLSREKELNKLKSQFISMVSHEYRTPLTVIFSSAELIKEFTKINYTDAIVDYSKRIQDSVRTLTDLLEGVMAVGEGVVIKVFKEDFEVKDFLEFVINSFKDSIKESHKIVFQVDFEDIKVKQDKNLLKQIINQILSNAVKFSDKNTEIQISASQNNNEVIISVKDQGRGIKDIELEMIFEPFFRASDVIGIIPGTGLGLSLARKNIEAVDGIYIFL